MHFCFALEVGDALPKRAAVRAYGVSQTVITVENRPEPERQHCSLTEAHTHYSGVLQNMLLVQTGGRAVKFAYNNRKVAAGVTQDCGSIHSLDPRQDKWPPCSCSVCEVPLLGEAVRVPGHKRSLQSWSEANLLTSVFETTRLFRTQEERAVEQNRTPNNASSFILRRGHQEMQQFRCNLHPPLRMRGPNHMILGRKRKKHRQADVQDQTGWNADPGEPKTQKLRDRSNRVLPGNGIGRFERH